MARLWCTTAILGLVACQHVAHREVSLPDGTVGYEATCRGHGVTIGDCMEEAHRTCSGAYDVIDKDSDTKATTAGNNLIVKTTHSLVFKCKG